jgi:hypothetical protein
MNKYIFILRQKNKIITMKIILHIFFNIDYPKLINSKGKMNKTILKVQKKQTKGTIDFPSGSRSITSLKDTSQVFNSLMFL